MLQMNKVCWRDYPLNSSSKAALQWCPCPDRRCWNIYFSLLIFSVVCPWPLKKECFHKGRGEP